MISKYDAMGTPATHRGRKHRIRTSYEYLLLTYETTIIIIVLRKISCYFPCAMKKEQKLNVENNIVDRL